MGSLRVREFADSPSMVLPPPNIHSFYASAHSHCIPYYQHLKPATHSLTGQQALVGSSKKRSRQSPEDDSALSRVKLPKPSPEAAQPDSKDSSHPTAGAAAMVGGQAEETVSEADRDMEMTDGDILNAHSSTTEIDSNISAMQGSSFNTKS
ncbi:MAG: hypothetical protein Q9178_001735 [Gyalolechia marmorata]